MFRWGIIGLSSGNGHPYSWSAIVNGYNRSRMEECGFPVIPRYLETHTTPDPRLKGFEVTSIYTQDQAASKHIADTCGIANVVDTMEELATSVDAVIVARDDAETHLDYAKRLLPFGKLVFFDKPLAYSTEEAKRILDLQAYEGQVWSASGLSFEPQVKKLAERTRTHRVISADAHISGPWERYAIHLIEPLLIAGAIPADIRKVSSLHSQSRVMANYAVVSDADDLDLKVTCWSKDEYAVAPTLAVLFADGSHETVVLRDTYEAFTGLLVEFGTICKGEKATDLSPMLRAIQLIEEAKE